MEPFLLTIDELRARGGGKWRNYPPDVIPAFVADMDFKISPAIQHVIARFTETQDYGYGQLTDTIALFEAFSKRMAARYSWRPDPQLTHANTDVVQGLVATITAFSDPGDGVIAQTPVYPPFLRSIANTSRLAGPREDRLASSQDRVSPESMMSSTTSTWRPVMSQSRSLRMRTTPDESVESP